jgi:hypothetical protein
MDKIITKPQEASGIMRQLIDEWSSVMQALDEMEVPRRQQKAIAQIAKKHIDAHAGGTLWVVPTKLTNRHFKKSGWKARKTS